MKPFNIVALALAAGLPGFAQASDTTLAGWTFSQFLSAGFPSINGQTFADVDEVVAVYRGTLPVPSITQIQGVQVGENEGTGYSNPSIGTFSFSNFNTTNASDVAAATINSFNTENGVTADGVNMWISDPRGTGLSFGLQNTKWEVQVNNIASYASSLSVSGFTNAAGSDFSYLAIGTGATVEWLYNNVVIATHNTTAAWATYTIPQVPAGFYTTGLLEGRLSAGAKVTIDNVQVNGAAIPEASTFAALAGVVALAFAGLRRRSC
jgi:hypothetical protein